MPTATVEREKRPAPLEDAVEESGEDNLYEGFQQSAGALRLLERLFEWWSRREDVLPLPATLVRPPAPRGPLAVLADPLTAEEVAEVGREMVAANQQAVEASDFLPLPFVTGYQLLRVLSDMSTLLKLHLLGGDIDPQQGLQLEARMDLLEKVLGNDVSNYGEVLRKVRGLYEHVRDRGDKQLTRAKIVELADGLERGVATAARMWRQEKKSSTWFLRPTVRNPLYLPSATGATDNDEGWAVLAGAWEKAERRKDEYLKWWGLHQEDWMVRFRKRRRLGKRELEGITAQQLEERAERVRRMEEERTQQAYIEEALRWMTRQRLLGTAAAVPTAKREEPWSEQPAQEAAVVAHALAPPPPQEGAQSHPVEALATPVAESLALVVREQEAEEVDHASRHPVENVHTEVSQQLNREAHDAYQEVLGVMQKKATEWRQQRAEALALQRGFLQGLQRQYRESRLSDMREGMRTGIVSARRLELERRRQDIIAQASVVDAQRCFNAVVRQLQQKEQNNKKALIPYPEEPRLTVRVKKEVEKLERVAKKEGVLDIDMAPIMRLLEGQAVGSPEELRTCGTRVWATHSNPALAHLAPQLPELLSPISQATPSPTASPPPLTLVDVPPPPPHQLPAADSDEDEETLEDAYAAAPEDPLPPTPMGAVPEGTPITPLNDDGSLPPPAPPGPPGGGGGGGPPGGGPPGPPPPPSDPRFNPLHDMTTTLQSLQPGTTAFVEHLMKIIEEAKKLFAIISGPQAAAATAVTTLVSYVVYWRWVMQSVTGTGRPTRNPPVIIVNPAPEQEERSPPRRRRRAPRTRAPNILEQARGDT